MREKLLRNENGKQILLKDVKLQGVLQLFNDRLKKYYFVKSTHLLHSLEDEISGNGNREIYRDMKEGHYFFFRLYVFDVAITNNIDAEIEDLFNSLVNKYNAYITGYLRKDGIRRIQDINNKKI